jgi:hypothetical protein
MKYITAAIIGCLLALPITWATAETKTEPKTEEKLVCEKTDGLVTKMNEKGFYHLLNMTNDNDVVETIWIAGTSIIITAQTGDNSCILASMKDVVYNPDTLKGLVNAYEKQTGKQKDI